jgi:hypothetical protein
MRVPRTAPRVPRTIITLYNKLMKLFFAGATHAGQICVREQIRTTLKRHMHA